MITLLLTLGSRWNYRLFLYAIMKIFIKQVSHLRENREHFSKHRLVQTGSLTDLSSPKKKQRGKRSTVTGVSTNQSVSHYCAVRNPGPPQQG